MAAPSVSELVAPAVTRLWQVVAGDVVAIVVAVRVVKSLKLKSRASRRATFSLVAFVGFCLSWYIVFGRTLR